MSKSAIIVDGIGKSYRIGHVAEKYPTFREVVMKSLSAPIRRFRRLSGNGATDETFWALKDVSFEVQPGEVVGIIGRNGAGKSTLLKILSRITEPTEGRAELRGRVASLLEVGTGFHPELTGRENIYLNGAILGMKRAEIDRNFDEIVAFAEIEKFLDTPVKRYSSGMYVRLAFAVAGHLDPEILIVDEVLAVGDAGFQKKCVKKMNDLSTGGRTVLFVSHNIAAVQGLCTRAIMLESGRLNVHGEIESIIHEYMVHMQDVCQTLLQHRTDRIGNGRARIVEIEVLDTKSQSVVKRVMSGQDVTFRIRYESEDEFKFLTNVTIGLRFSTMQGTFVTVLNNRMSNQVFERLPPTSEVYCRVPKLPLMAGHYFLGFTLDVAGHKVDHLDEAVEVQVEMGDFYNTGIDNTFGRQGVYIEQSWRTPVRIDGIDGHIDDGEVPGLGP